MGSYRFVYYSRNDVILYYADRILWHCWRLEKGKNIFCVFIWIVYTTIFECWNCHNIHFVRIIYHHCNGFTKFACRFRLSPKRRDDLCMDSETNRKLRNAARSCARFSRSASPYCADAKATLCIYRRMGWIGSRSFQKTNMKKIGADMFNVPAFKRVVGGSTKQGGKTIDDPILL